MPRVNSSDEVFKKTEQVVGKPETTKHNINEEYMRNAPENTDRSVNQHKQTYHRRMSVSAKKGGSEGGLTHTLEDLAEVEPHEGLGRQKMEDELADIAQDAVHR